MKGKMMKKILITIDEETLKLLEDMAYANKTSKSQMIRRLIIEEEKRESNKVV
jgi:predicted transcriptional regulator